MSGLGSGSYGVGCEGSFGDSTTAAATAAVCGDIHMARYAHRFTRMKRDDLISDLTNILAVHHGMFVSSWAVR